MDAKKVIEEVDSLMKDASASERLETIASLALAEGFESFLTEKVAELAPVSIDKTASMGYERAEKGKGGENLFSSEDYALAEYARAKGGKVTKEEWEKAGKPHLKKASESDRKILYSKLNVDDIIGHLASQFGRVEGVDKEASHRPGFAKLAKFVQEELARPT